MFPMSSSRQAKNLLLSLAIFITTLLCSPVAWANETDTENPLGSVGGQVHADLFTGTASTSIPIAVPPGRNGVQPELSLVYGSANGNGWVGMGWKLEKSVIERMTKDGLDYTGDDFVVRLSGINGELVNIGGGEYRAKIEGKFTRVQKLTATDGEPYFLATDKMGKKHFFGQTIASRVVDPADATRIFRWCLDRVEDVHGNYMTISYVGDQGQSYLSQIDYTGNTGQSLSPIHSVIFHLEDRTDAPPQYRTEFLMKTAKRLKTVEVRANGNLVRAYKLTYTTSANTSRSLLQSVQQYGRDATIDGTGTITSGTSLPPLNVGWQTNADGIFTFTKSLPGASVATQSYIQTNNKDIHTGDFNGDGLTDMLHLQSNPDPQYSWVALSDGDGTFTFDNTKLPGASVATNSYLDWANWNIQTGDFNGDGLTDMLHLHPDPDPQYSWVALSNGDGTFTFTKSLPGASVATNSFIDASHQIIRMGDFNGDGLTDMLHLHPNADPQYSWVALSNGDGTFNFSQSLPGASVTTQSHIQTNNKDIHMGDFNGDGYTDMLHLQPNPDPQYSWVALSNGDGTFTFDNTKLPGASVATSSYIDWAVWNIQTGDFNGDGLTDMMHLHPDAAPQYSWVALSKGDGTFNFDKSLPGASVATSSFIDASYLTIYPSDYNGDGLTDILHLHPNADPQYSWQALSNGDGTFTFSQSLPGASVATNSFIDLWHLNIHLGDFDGNGIIDMLHLHPNADPQYSWVALNNGTKPDLLTSVANGLGGTTTITYTPSTEWNNELLPYVTQTVSQITTDDGNGVIASNNYEYGGAYHHLGEREFRGFEYAKVIGPAGPNGEQAITETWFHQGNDTAVDVNDPTDPVGYLKGAPYRSETRDASGNLYTRTLTTYTPDDNGQAPYFTPTAQVVTDVCDGNASCVQTKSEYTYDVYGNILQDKQYGDVAVTTDDRTVVHAYAYNTTDWLIAFPSSKTMYEGIGTGGTQVSHADFYYDGTTDCNTASTNQVPTKGLLTRSVNWLSGGTDPETRIAYNAIGNPICSRDANGNESTKTYDSQQMFQISSTNALGHVRTTQYYGVDSVLDDNGQYGQIKQRTDPNGAVGSFTYDALGRVLTITQPDGFTVTNSFMNFGTVGSQHIKSVDTFGLTKWSYFDGLGRTIKTEKIGTDSKIVVTETQYDVRSKVLKSSLPYFKVGGTPLWITHKYDPMGRILETQRPDGSKILKCYDDWTSVTIDPNGHKARQTRNSFGEPLSVREYEGTYTTCDTSLGTAYSTTTYQYNVQGQIRFTTDDLGNVTELQYNSLSRKVFMHDPDMGDWAYEYDAVGNIVKQTDAKGQIIHFQLDALNRLVQKDYSTIKALGSGDVVYTYDGATSNGIGRLTHVADSSGSTTFYYDIVGQVIQTDKVIGASTYTTYSTYDGLGRQTTTTYPDSKVVNYFYNGPELKSVEGETVTHALYAGWNAMGQPATATFSNGVTTTYTYDSQNFRLDTLQTVNSTSQVLQDLDYTFDAGGMIDAITDPVHGNQTFGYDDLGRITSANGPYGNLTYAYDSIGNMTSNSRLGTGTTHTYNPSGPGSVRPHAAITAAGNSYGYDANGNMTSGAGRVITYDIENRPTRIVMNGVTSTFTYDGDGGRVSKHDTQLGLTTTYVGNYYVCEGAICSRYIFAGDKRIAKVESVSGNTHYFHPDHLGSTSVVSDSNGNNAQDIVYTPYGDTYSNTGTTDVRYKFNGKEKDDSTGLYFYEARYYDPWLGRFISADTVVPDPFDPQSRNRYSYVRNNPMVYTDPSGHFFKGIIKFFSNPFSLAGLAINPWLGYTIAGGINSNWDVGSMALQQAVAFTSAFTGGVAGPALAGLGSGAGFTALGIFGGAAVATLTSSALYDLAGYDVNYGQSLATSLAVATITAGVASIPNIPNWAVLGVGTISSGIASELTGGDFSMTIMNSFVVAGASYYGSQLANGFESGSQDNSKDLVDEEHIQVADNGMTNHRYHSREKTKGAWLEGETRAPECRGKCEAGITFYHGRGNTTLNLKEGTIDHNSTFKKKFGMKMYWLEDFATQGENATIGGRLLPHPQAPGATIQLHRNKNTGKWEPHGIGMDAEFTF